MAVHEQFEMMNERFRVVCQTPRRGQAHLVIFKAEGTLRQLAARLADDPDALLDFVAPDAATIDGIAAAADRNIEV